MNGQTSGWSRYFDTGNFCQIGWHKNFFMRHGNLRIYYKGNLIKEGWFEDGQHIGGFKESSEFKFWHNKSSYYMVPKSKRDDKILI